MFSYLRYFAAVSILLVAAGAYLLSSYFSNIYRSDTLRIENQTAISALHAYAQSVWAAESDPSTHAPSAAQLPAYQEATRKFFESYPLLKLTIFSPDVKQLYYSSTNAYVTDRDAQRTTLFSMDRVGAGESVSRVLYDAHVVNADGAPEARTLVQMIIPIARPDGTTPAALAEVYIDVSEPWHRQTMAQYQVMGAVVITFIIMMGVLIGTALRGEAIITKQHEVNLELTAAASQAEAQSHSKSQFLASVSHELRTPLNSIIGFSEILRDEVKPNLNKIYQDYIDDIYASGRHLLSLINDILDYSKAEAGKLQMDWAETDVTKVIHNSLRMVMPRAETSQVTLIEDIPSHHLVVVTDPKKLKQVLLNLLSNAVKFTRAGGEVRCKAWIEVTTGNLMIIVKDTGIGIAPKDISKVMTAFGQVDSVLSRKFEGTGLGLPLSKKFVEMMGGSFDIESEPNVGTTITLSIPKVPPNWQNETQPSAEEKDVTSAS